MAPSTRPDYSGKNSERKARHACSFPSSHGMKPLTCALSTQIGTMLPCDLQLATGRMSIKL
jgi:hypothetical protein